MKQVININFQGRVVPIEVTAFEILKRYTESLGRYFANEEGKDEIINDIESRIGELFQERLKAGTTCITDEDVNAIIRSMGRPEDFETAETASSTEKAFDNNSNNEQSHASSTFTSQAGPKRLYRNENDKVIGGVCSGLANYFGIDVVVMRIIFVVLAVTFGFGLIPYLILWVAVPSSASTEIGAVRKKLFRDGEDKIIAGVCSGIGNYFGVNAWIPRIFFLLPFLSFVSRWDDNHWGEFFRVGFSPGALLIYIILWLVIPEAVTTTEKLEMKGEKVDMNSIKNSIMEEMKGLQDRAEKFGKQASAVAGEKSKAFAAETTTLAKRSSRSLGDIIALLFKIFAYFIAGCIGFAVIAALFALGIFSIGIFPVKGFVLNDGWQDVFAWGTLIFFIAVPIIGALTWIIRKLARIKTNSKPMRFSFISLWIIGWACFIFLIASVTKQFRSANTIKEEEIALVNPLVDKLEITSNNPGQKIYRNRWFRLEPFESIEEDTAFVRNVSVHIIKSPNDSFRVTMLRLSNGPTKAIANRLASQINFDAVQKDSALVVDRGIAINRTDKFRNQRVIITVYVPVGKKIRVDRSVGWENHVRFEGPFYNNWDIDFEDLEHGWSHNEDYIMKADGLYSLDGKPADDWDYQRNERRVSVDGDEIDIRESNSRISVDSAGVNITNGDNNQYRYRINTPPANLVDSIQQKIKEEKTKTADSLRKVKEQIDQQLKQIEKKAADPTAGVTGILPVYNPMILMK